METTLEANKKKEIRVFVVDDHPTFADGLVKLLSEDADLKPVGTANDGEEAITAIKISKPDVIVMDISMPRMNGIEATRLIKQELPGIAVLILSVYNYEPYVLAALEAGVGGYLLKNVPMKQLIAAIKGLNAGETVLNQELASKVLRAVIRSRGVHGTLNNLSTSDIELLKLGATGMNNHDIAAKLFISERTVQSHFTSIFNKLSVGSRIEAVVRAIKEGWISVEDLP